MKLEALREQVYLNLRIQLAMNIGDVTVRDHKSAEEALRTRTPFEADARLYQRFGLRPIVTGLFISSSITE
jgi:hypothetical protein